MMTLRKYAEMVSDVHLLDVDESVTLINCDREPIHIPGQAQDFGAVVVLDLNGDGLKVVQVSANVDRHFGISTEQILGMDAVALFGAENVAILAAAIDGEKLESNPQYLFTCPVWCCSLFHATAHTYAGVLIIELEPADGNGDGQVQSGRPGSHAMLRTGISMLRGATSLTAYCQAVCKAIQEVSGFDRVMVYEFHADAHGEVIAEVISASDKREPYLGLHYPSSDIPKQARALYMLNTIRLLPDARYERSPIVPPLNPITGRPLDMTHCVLRGYSQMYTEYLTNMGSRASMSIAIIRGEALWGLIACHHQSVRQVSYEVRAACEFLGEVVSLQIADKKASEEADYLEHIQDVHLSLVGEMEKHGMLMAGLAAVEPGTTVLNLIQAGGCAVLSDMECQLLGDTPSEDEVRTLVRWLTDTRPAGEDVWATDDLAAIYPPAGSKLDKMAGVLASRVTTAELDNDWVLWFRPEFVRTVNWGGDPTKPYEVGPLGDRLTPRKSFELWQETVRGRSLPWKDVELSGARQLRRSAIAHIISGRAKELARLNAELAQSNVELDSFAYATSHDLKEPLRGINNYIRFLREDNVNLLTPDAEEKLDTVVRLSTRMDSLLDSLLHYSQLGRQLLVFENVNLNLVLADVIETLLPRLHLSGITVRIPRILPTSVRCDSVQIGELFTNLIANAIKYNDRPPGEKWIEIGWIDTRSPVADGFPVKLPDKPLARTIFYVRDNGIGILEKHYAIIFRIFKRLHGRADYQGGTGAGLTISQKVVERHGGKIWVESVPGEGSTFFFTLGGKP